MIRNKKIRTVQKSKATFSHIAYCTENQLERHKEIYSQIEISPIHKHRNRIPSGIYFPMTSYIQRTTFPMHKMAFESCLGYFLFDKENHRMGWYEDKNDR